MNEPWSQETEKRRCLNFQCRCTTRLKNICGILTILWSIFAPEKRERNVQHSSHGFGVSQRSYVLLTWRTILFSVLPLTDRFNVGIGGKISAVIETRESHRIFGAKRGRPISDSMKHQIHAYVNARYIKDKSILRKRIALGAEYDRHERVTVRSFVVSRELTKSSVRMKTNGGGEFNQRSSHKMLYNRYCMTFDSIISVLDLRASLRLCIHFL